MSVTEHYVERTWASLLSRPLTDEDAMSLKAATIGIESHQGGSHGVLNLAM